MRVYMSKISVFVSCSNNAALTKSNNAEILTIRSWSKESTLIHTVPDCKTE